MLLAFKDAIFPHMLVTLPLVASLLYVLIMTIVFDYICITVHLYTITICKVAVIMDMYLCILLVAICVLCSFLGIYMGIM